MRDNNETICSEKTGLLSLLLCPTTPKRAPNSNGPRLQHGRLRRRRDIDWPLAFSEVVVEDHITKPKKKRLKYNKRSKTFRSDEVLDKSTTSLFCCRKIAGGLPPLSSTVTTTKKTGQLSLVFCFL